MRQAIRVLEARAEKVRQDIQKSQKIADEPEMLSDYEFAINDIGNYELELIELGEAIKILNNHKK
jgi:hypothetical protein